MILCSCHVLTHTEIEAAARALSAAEPSRSVTPARVFQRLGMRAQCGSCAETIRLLLRDLGLGVAADGLSALSEADGEPPRPSAALT